MFFFLRIYSFPVLPLSEIANFINGWMLWGAIVRHDQSASRFKLEDQKAKRCHKRRREHVTDGKKGCNKGSSRGFTTLKFILRSAYDSCEGGSQKKKRVTWTHFKGQYSFFEHTELAFQGCYGLSGFVEPWTILPWLDLLLLTLPVLTLIQFHELTFKSSQIPPPQEMGPGTSDEKFGRTILVTNSACNKTCNSLLLSDSFLSRASFSFSNASVWPWTSSIWSFQSHQRK